MQTERLDAPPPPSITDRRGERHERLVVTGFAGRDRHGISLWHCRCDCGGSTVVRSNHLRVAVRSCGCLRHSPRVRIADVALPGGDRVVDDGATADAVVVLRCPEGHVWERRRKAMCRRRVAAYQGTRACSQCPVCRVNGTIDLRGHVSGLLTVIARAGSDAPADGRFRGQATWRVRCACGAEKTLRGSHLRRGEQSVRTCGARACMALWRQIAAGNAG